LGASIARQRARSLPSISVRTLRRTSSTVCSTQGWTWWRLTCLERLLWARIVRETQGRILRGGGLWNGGRGLSWTIGRGCKVFFVFGRLLVPHRHVYLSSLKASSFNLSITNESIYLQTQVIHSSYPSSHSCPGNRTATIINSLHSDSIFFGSKTGFFHFILTMSSKIQY